MGPVERFKRRKQILAQSKEKNGLILVPDKALVNNFLNSEVDEQSVLKVETEMDNIYGFEFNIEVFDEEGQELLHSLEKEFNDARFNDLIDSCKNDVLSAVITPFGLGGLVARGDKNGGNVTTNHNFKDGVTAIPEDAQRYKEWQESQEKFNREPYDYDNKLDKKGNVIINKKGEPVKIQFNSTKKKEMYNNINDGDVVADGYNGKVLGIKRNNIDKKTQIDLEHITPVKEIETDPQNHLFANGNNSKERQDDRVALARDDNNLTLINGPMNSSKNDKDLIKWANEPNRKDTSKTNAEYYELNSELIKQEYKKSKDFLKKENFNRQIKKQGKEIIGTGAKEGVKMGFQQAIGLVVCEFFKATFDEIKDIYNNGFSIDGECSCFINTLKIRLEKIAKRIAARWQDALKAFGTGFISGFLSNLVTVIINMFIRTGKRVIRIIREGFFSLLKALKMLCFPPEGISFAQAAHEASKLIAAGLAVVGGISLEQHIDNIIKATPVLEPIADALTTVIIGGATGLAVTFIIYAIDEVDILKVNDKAEHEFIMDKLESSLDSMFIEGDRLIRAI